MKHYLCEPVYWFFVVWTIAFLGLGIAIGESKCNPPNEIHRVK